MQIKRINMPRKEWLIVAYLDSVQARLASLRELQSQTQEELDALLPSVLRPQGRAFSGKWEYVEVRDE